MSTSSRHEESRAAERAMAWYGWGSPVGLAIFLVALSILLVAAGTLVLLVRLAIFGLWAR
ncbi:MAG: hypothetical protein L6R19_23000 [Alphaproteobacteria bacterium]|nr:hypothetical protein [Alphaproteobacteria bacterium]